MEQHRRMAMRCCLVFFQAVKVLSMWNLLVNGKKKTIDLFMSLLDIAGRKCYNYRIRTDLPE